MPNRYLMSGGRYPVLRSLALLYLIGAAVAVIGGAAAAAWALIWAPDTVNHRLVLALGVLAGTFFIVISMLAIAEVLKLFMDIEHNSRMIHFGDSVGAAMNGEAPSSTKVGASRMVELDEETAEGALIRGR